MTTLDDINAARNSLMDSLGNQKEPYMKFMKQWFQMKLSKTEFDTEVRTILDSTQISLHNDFMSQLFQKCIQSTRAFRPISSVSGNKHRSKTVTNNKRRNRQSNGGFQPTDIHDHVNVCRSTRPQDEPLRYCTQELLLPDHDFIYLRLMWAAWHNGLKGAENSAADLLVVAIQHFLKDVITAIISRRKGYQLKHGKFMHGLGTPVPNPWLRNTVNLIKDDSDDCVMEVSETDENHLIPVPRQTPDQLQQEIALRLCCSSSEVCNSHAITPSFCLEALQVHRSTVFSNSVYAVNMERIVSQIYHPSWEEIGE
uniref:Uncharacterized protein n=1 Tax=Clastoptera arizonana TaxID=38151 RepID=A0A1B6DIG1_9HEMI